MIDRLSSYRIVSSVLGSVLLVAGFLKWLQQPVAGSWLEGAATDATAVFEALLGVWLLLGLSPRASWWVLSGCFVAFLGVSLDKAIAGETSCGCFGKLEVPPWYMVVFDGVAILALAVSSGNPPSAQVRSTSGWRTAVVFGIIASVVVAGVVGFRVAAESVTGAIGEEMAEGGTVRMTPDEWVGSPFPYFRYLDSGERLKAGDWVLMFYHTNCARCREALPQYVGLARQLTDASSETRVALVEMPPFPSSGGNGTDGRAAFLHTRLSERYRWQLEAPHFLRLRDGVVVRSTKNAAAILDDLGVAAVVRGDVAEPDRMLPDYRRIRREAFLREIACGPLALIGVLEAAGIHLSPVESDRLIAEAGSEGIDLLRLKQLVEERGLFTLGVSVTPEKLKKMGHLAIVRLNRIGFAAATGYPADGVVITQPLRPPGVLPDSVFGQMFGKEGVALLVSRNPLTQEGLGLGSDDERYQRVGPHLRLSKTILTAGRINRSDWQAEMTLFNDGSEPLVIKGISTTCTCFTVKPDQAEIPPGGSTVLRAKGVELRLGSFTYRLTLATNQASQGDVTIPVRGYVEQPVGFEFPAKQFRGLLPSQPFEFDVGLDLPATIAPEQLCLDVPPGSPLSVRARRLEGNRCVLSIQSSGAPTVGWHRWQIGISLDPAEKSVVSTFYLACEVIPGIDLTSSSAFVPDAELLRGDWSRSFTARSHCSVTGDWKVSWADPRMNALIDVKVSNQAEATVVTLKPLVVGQKQPTEGRAELIVEKPNGFRRSFTLYLGASAFADSRKGDK